MNFKTIAFSSLILSSTVMGAEFDSKELYKRESNWTVFSNNSKIRMCRIGKLEDDVELIKKMRVHFDNDSSKVSSDQINAIHLFMNANFKEGYRIVLDGHSDLEGNIRYNKRLSNERVKKVLEIIRETATFVEDTKIKSIFHGESKSTVHDRVDRYVDIRIEKINLEKGQFNKVYLFDASEYMANGYSDSGLRYNEIRTYRLPTDAIGYVVRDYNTKCDGPKLKDYDPKGPEVLKEGMLVIANNLKGSVKVFLYTSATQKIKSVDQDELNKAVMKTIKTEDSIWYQF